MLSHDSTPVNNSLETAEENGGVMEKSSTKIISESPVKENLAPAATPTTVDIGLSAQVKSRWSFSSSKRSFGSSKDDTFFESHQWLQSDSEDEFYSVHGDFTPSLGNTPKCSFSERLPRFQNPLFEEDQKPRVSFSHIPAPRRKKLGELFRDSMREQREVILEESSENQSENSKKSSSGDNSGELKVIEDSVKEKKNLKSLNHHHRCLPRFSSFKGSLMEKRKKKKKKIHVK